MSHIKYQTDAWGAKDATHLEIEFQGMTVFIDIDDEKIKVLSHGEITSLRPAINVVEIVSLQPRAERDRRQPTPKEGSE